MNIQIPRI